VQSQTQSMDGVLLLIGIVMADLVVVARWNRRRTPVRGLSGTIQTRIRRLLRTFPANK
jgi:hypothetical protein